MVSESLRTPPSASSITAEIVRLQAPKLCTDSALPKKGDGKEPRGVSSPASCLEQGCCWHQPRSATAFPGQASESSEDRALTCSALPCTTLPGGTLHQAPVMGGGESVRQGWAVLRLTGQLQAETLPCPVAASSSCCQVPAVGAKSSASAQLSCARSSPASSPVRPR